MPSLRQQIREYFDAHSLPANRVDEILHAGRQAAAGEAPPQKSRVIAFWPRALALAAAVALFAGLAFLVVPRPTKQVDFAALAPRVVQFFGAPPELPKLSQDKAALRAWHLAQGAPAEFSIPEKLLPLESYGCAVIDTQGQPAYLTCFWRGKPPESGLIHLLAVRRDGFREVPGREPQTRQIGDWSFVSWTKGELVYTLAAIAPPEQVRAFAATSPLRRGESWTPIAQVRF